MLIKLSIIAMYKVTATMLFLLLASSTFAQNRITIEDVYPILREQSYKEEWGVPPCEVQSITEAEIYQTGRQYDLLGTTVHPIRVSNAGICVSDIRDDRYWEPVGRRTFKFTSSFEFHFYYNSFDELKVHDSKLLEVEKNLIREEDFRVKKEERDQRRTGQSNNSSSTCTQDINEKAMNYSLYYEAYKAGDFAKAQPYLDWIIGCDPGFAGPQKADARNINRALDIINHYIDSSSSGLSSEQKSFGQKLFGISEAKLNELGVNISAWQQSKERFLSVTRGTNQGVNLPPLPKNDSRNNDNADQGDADRSGYAYQVEGLNRESVLTSFPRYNDKVNVTIRMRITVNPRGEIIQSIPLIKGNPRLEQSVMVALRNWRFNPLPPNVPQENQTGTIIFQFGLE